MSILMGMFIVAIGVRLMVYAHKIVELLGPIQRAEEKIGGTRKFYILLGMGIVMIGFLFIFGVFDTNSPEQAMDAGFGKVQKLK